MIKFVFTLLLTAFLLSGCSPYRSYLNLLGWQLKTKTADVFQESQRREKHTSPERCYFVQGSVSCESQEKDIPIVVVGVSVQASKHEIVDSYILDKAGYYSLYLPEGEYRILAFADIDGSGVFDGDELVGEYESYLLIHADENENESQEKVIENINIHIAYDSARISDTPVKLRIPKIQSWRQSGSFPLGTITTLDDKLFSRKFGMLGAYRPAAFLEKAPYLFYALEDYDPDKVPIIFVHGIGGTPLDWAYIVEHIDLDRFQPWFFYYPSGECISKVSEMFYRIFLSGEILKIGKKPFVITAHSMGGLVVREALNKYEKAGRSEPPKIFVSFCTPFGGDDRAASAMKVSPIVMPSWRDVAVGSDFMDNLFRREISSDMQHYLFFAYRKKMTTDWENNTDGRVTLKSQLEPRARSEAAQIYGYPGTHSGILSDEKAVAKYIEILSSLIKK